MSLPSITPDPASPAIAPASSHRSRVGWSRNRRAISSPCQAPPHAEARAWGSAQRMAAVAATPAADASPVEAAWVAS
eukprot:scaffold13511_cov132-Isochrysis_galbana.AAC.1